MRKGKTLLGVVNKLLRRKSLLTSPSNVLPYYLKQTFPQIIRIFTQGEKDEIEPKLSSSIFSTLCISAKVETLILNGLWTNRIDEKVVNALMP